MWFSLASHGVAAYREAVETALSMARLTASRIAEHPRLELVREPDLSIVMFRRVGWLQADYDAWSRELLSAGIGFVLPSKWMDEPILRFAFLHPETTPQIIEEILATLG
jgi:glutamate/tyrosine decarboxylase-like PLP-dependent enzyme